MTHGHLWLALLNFTCAWKIHLMLLHEIPSDIVKLRLHLLVLIRTRCSFGSKNHCTEITKFNSLQEIKSAHTIWSRPISVSVLKTQAKEQYSMMTLFLKKSKECEYSHFYAWTLPFQAGYIHLKIETARVWLNYNNQGIHKTYLLSKTWTHKVWNVRRWKDKMHSKMRRGTDILCMT